MATIKLHALSASRIYTELSFLLTFFFSLLPFYPYRPIFSSSIYPPFDVRHFERLLQITFAWLILPGRFIKRTSSKGGDFVLRAWPGLSKPDSTKANFSNFSTSQTLHATHAIPMSLFTFDGFASVVRYYELCITTIALVQSFRTTL